MKATAKTIFSGVPEAPAAATPLPTATHQSIIGCLFTEISIYLKAKEPQFRVMAAPFAVFFKNSGRICLQPDIVVVQDEGKLDEEGCHGAPDWVIEVVSPSSRGQDYGQKLGIYINAGVREYWIVDSEKKLIVTYCLEHPDVPDIYHFGDIVKSDIYPDLVIDSSQLDRIQYRKAVDTGDRPDEDLVASLASAVRIALSKTGSDAPVPTGLIEDIVANELDKAGWQPGSHMPTYQEYHDAADDTINDPADKTTSGAMTDPAEVTAFILEHFPDLAAAKNKGQLMKTTMSMLKGRAESRVINAAVAELCR